MGVQQHFDGVYMLREGADDVRDLLQRQVLRIGGGRGGRHIPKQGFQQLQSTVLSGHMNNGLNRRMEEIKPVAAAA